MFLDLWKHRKHVLHDIIETLYLNKETCYWGVITANWGRPALASSIQEAMTSLKLNEQKLCKDKNQIN